MTTQINIDTKSQLAKLIATENITIQHNQVKTASFDTVNRILTLPIFKVQSGDVYDMLIAHECSHALFTPTDGWAKISGDDELRAYVNVLEDTRIDKLIQKKYPGVVRNYLNGFDIMEKQNFFGLQGKDVNTDLMLIDKINMRSKSMNRIKFNFSSEDKNWLVKVDALKTFNQVVKLAKEMLNWQKDQIEQMKKLPDFDNHVLVENYGLGEELDSDNNVNTKDGNSNIESNNSDNDNANEGDQESQANISDENSEDGEGKEANAYNTDGAGGDGGVDPKKLVAITDSSYEKNKEKLLDGKTKYTYFNLPEPNLKNVMVSSKDWIKKWKEYAYKKDEYYSNDKRIEYINWLKDNFKQFKNDNKKTVNYLVKEFEMKKSATAYKRASTDKTGVIDPLKLKDYKFSDDLFKRLTILPDAKNHGMMMLLDWSGSMSDSIYKTVQQLIQLVYFCHKVNIPYDVYFFTSEFENDNPRLIGHGRLSDGFKYKSGDMALDSVKLVNVANHKLKKIQLDESMMYLYWLALHYDNRYSSYRDWDYSKPDSPSIPREYYLGSTPLNEALVVMLKLVPMFKEKYKVEKMNFITLTDGGGNYGSSQVFTTNDDGKLIATESKGDNDVYIYKKKQYTLPRHIWGSGKTAMYLNMLRKICNIRTIGFYLIKRIRGYDAERYFKDSYNSKLTWDQKDKLYQKRKSDFAKNKVAVIKQDGYDDYYLVNAKDMKVENTDISQVNSDMKVGRIKQLFSKSMKGRITSRVLLNKFIEKVA